MKKPKLIIVSGMSGAGKSTTSQGIARLYRQNGIHNHWYHEEMEEHPIRWANGGEFKAGDLKTEEGMTLNIEDMFERWSRFLDNISAIGGIHVMEGCLYQNIIRYFFSGGYSKEKVIIYYNKLMEILDRVDTRIIFLYSKDVRATLEKAFEVRGENWKQLILDPGDDEYFQIHGYDGDCSVFAMWEDYRNLSDKVFSRYNGSKLKVEVDKTIRQWDVHMRKIAEFLDLKYFEREETELRDKSRYCGRLYNSEGKKLSLSVSCVNDQLFFNTSWFKYIKMVSIGQDQFELSAFPTILSYRFESGIKRVEISGNYGWDINGENFEIKME